MTIQTIAERYNLTLKPCARCADEPEDRFHCIDCGGSGITLPYVNEDSKSWRHSYMVHLSPIGSGILVTADNDQDALDYAVDYAEEQGWEGYFLDPEDDWTKELEGYGEVLYAGNHGRMLHDDGNMSIVQLD